MKSCISFTRGCYHQRGYLFSKNAYSMLIWTVCKWFYKLLPTQNPIFAPGHDRQIFLHHRLSFWSPKHGNQGRYNKDDKPFSLLNPEFCLLSRKLDCTDVQLSNWVFTGFVQTVKYCFPGLSRTCKDQIPGFSRTHKTRFQRLSRINSVQNHGCIRSKKCTYQISYQCNCITVNKPKSNNWNSNWPKR